MPDIERLSDDGTRRHKLKISLFVLSVILALAAVQIVQERVNLLTATLLLAAIFACGAWSLRSSTWFLADSVDYADGNLVIRRDRRNVRVAFGDIIDVMRGPSLHPGTIAICFRSNVKGFGTSVTYRVAGYDAITTDELLQRITSLRSRLGLPPLANDDGGLNDEGRSRLKRKRWTMGALLLACAPIWVNWTFALHWFAPYDRQLSGLALAIVLIAFFAVGFSQEELDEVFNSHQRKRR